MHGAVLQLEPHVLAVGQLQHARGADVHRMARQQRLHRRRGHDRRRGHLDPSVAAELFLRRAAHVAQRRMDLQLPAVRFRCSHIRSPFALPAVFHPSAVRSRPRPAPQPRPRRAEPLPHRVRPQAEQLRQFPRGIALKRAEHEQRLFVRRQPPEQLRHRHAGEVVLPGRLRGRLRQRLRAARAAAAVNADALCRAVQPGPAGRPVHVHELLRMGQRAQERLLRRVLGGGAAVQQAGQKAHQLVIVQRIQLLDHAAHLLFVRRS